MVAQSVKIALSDHTAPRVGTKFLSFYFELIYSILLKNMFIKVSPA